MSVPTKLQKTVPYEKVYWGARQERLGVRLTTHKVGAEDLGSEEDQGAEDQGAEDQDAEDQEDGDIKYKYNIWRELAEEVAEESAENQEKDGEEGDGEEEAVAIVEDKR